MRIVFSSIILFIIPLLTSCSNCKVTKDEETIQDKNNPTTVVQNLSIVNAQVLEIFFKSETDYQIKVKVTEVENTERYPSMAVSGNEYLLTPNFRYDNESLIENDINDSFKKLSKLSGDKMFKAEISFEYQKGWYIQKVLSIE